MAEATPGKLINGKYRLLAELGRGAMGVVYRVEQLDVEGRPLRQVALKTLLPHLSTNPDFSRRFLREVRVAMQLRSPHTVTVYDSGKKVPADVTNGMPAAIELLTPQPASMAAEQPRLYVRLVRRSPLDNLPREIAFIHDNTLIGSGSECDVILKHPSIARQHARVQWRKQGYVLCDLGSPTGTYINGRRISENLLKDGWTVRFGEVEFVFHGTKPQP